MRNKILLLILLFAIAQVCNGQMPLPCLKYESEAQLESFYGVMNTNCVEIDMGPWWAGIDDEHYRGFEVEYGIINAGTAGSDGIVITPGTDLTSGFQIALREAPPEGELQAAWFEPTDSYDVPLYEKVEWGIILPTEVQTAIDNWISNDQNGTTLTPAINPFDPEQIDVYAEVWQPGASQYQPVYGFYYREYERIWEGNNPNNLPEMDDPDNWFRQEVSSDYDFRFRWSSTVQGWHTVKLKIDVPGMGEWESQTFNFKAVWNDPKRSFLSKTPNRKYFQTADGEIFFPVGENLFPQTAECPKDVPDIAWDPSTLDCEQCYTEGNNSLLCGLDEFPFENLELDWRGSFWRGFRIDLEHSTEHMATYLVQLQYMEALKNAGANAFRTMPNAISYDFEFERLNNYYDRQFMAWELDELFDKAHEIDLRVEFCMMYHVIFGHTFSKQWDWTSFEDPGETCCIQEFRGNCYFMESDKTDCDTEPISFFREEDAKNYYKKKLRYFIARFGWCPEIIDL
ncbi:MAG: hypothetical protein ACKVOK_00230, partial [Flavobacteriales bacterium]